MSHDATTWAWGQNVGNPVRKMILLHIAQAANPDQNNNETWHSYETIRKACNCSRGSVHNHIKWLLEHDYLTLIKQSTRAGETNRYRLNVGYVRVQQGPSSCSGDERAVQEMNEDGSSGVCDRSSGVPDGSSVVHKPVIQPVSKPVSKTDRRLIPKPLKEKYSPPDWMPIDQWADYLESRRDKKHPMTAGALKLCVKAIDKAVGQGKPVDVVMDKLIETGWRTIEAGWLDRKSQGPNSNLPDNSAHAARLTAELKEQAKNAT